MDAASDARSLKSWGPKKERQGRSPKKKTQIHKQKMHEYVSFGRLRRRLVAQHYPECCYEIASRLDSTAYD